MRVAIWIQGASGSDNAGHFPPAILVTTNGEAKADFIEQRGKPVGLFDEVRYEARTVNLEVVDSRRRARGGAHLLDGGLCCTQTHPKRR